LRALEGEILDARQAAARPSSASWKQKSSLAGESGNVVLDYCSTVRGILNDNHGGSAHPAGLRMLEALGDVQKSLQRVASSGKTGPAIDLLARLRGFIDRGMVDQRKPFARVAAIHPTGASGDEVADPMKMACRWHNASRDLQRSSKNFNVVRMMGPMCISTKCDGVVSPRPVVGARLAAYPRDNLDLGAMVSLSKIA